MKLGEALAERARLQTRIGELRTRINDNAATQEGTEPAESSATLIEEALNVHGQLADLIMRINMTNASAAFDPPYNSLTGALARRDQLAGMVATVRGAADSAQSGSREMRYMRSELAIQRNVNVGVLRRQQDEFAAEMRRLDTRIQETNWATDLVEERRDATTTE